MEKLIGGFGFLEAPVWDRDSDALLFADPALGGVWRLGTSGTLDCPFPHRRGIAGMALHAEGGVIIGGRNLAWKRNDETIPLLNIPSGLTRFNDLTTDPDGRVYVGSIDMEPSGDPPTRQPGFLHLVDIDGTSRILTENLQITNGMKVSPDGTRLYHGDTGDQTIWVYERAEDGSLANRRPLIRWERGGPDGMAIASDGTLFVVLVYTGQGGQVAVISPEGAELERIPVPGPATSLCFGGPDLRTLYVVTGGAHSGEDRAGAVFAHPVPVAGLPLPPARIRPNSR